MLDVPVNSAADETRGCRTWLQKEQTLEDEQKIKGARKTTEVQDPESGARSLPIEKLDISSQMGETKSKRSSVISKTASAQRVLHLELKALKE